MSDFVIPLLFLLDGLLLAGIAVFAHSLGLDPNAAWGRTRFFLFLIGTILIFISLLLVNSKKRKATLIDHTIKSDIAKTLLLLGHIWLIIFLIYIWFITFGNFTTWNHTTRYYTQLADAFGKGQIYVDQKPGKALLAAIDPYDPKTRPVFDDEIWDMSLYKGKLYLYWGPIPALLIAPIQLSKGQKITDNYLVFFFFAGLLVINSLIILKLWRKLFTSIPAWNVFICIPLIGLILPILWSTDIPNVYEVAIGAGQFFLMTGIYFALPVFDHNAFSDKWRLFLAGLFWACSVGTRAMNAMSVIFLAALAGFWIWKNLPRPINWTEYVRRIAPLFAPLIFGAIAIGWYNWARFDSPLEFGLRYQITILNLNKLINSVFQPDYIFPNLYVYLFQPFEFLSKFPYIQPIITSDVLSKLNIVTPQIYFAGRMTGLLFGAPFLLLCLVHLYPKDKAIEDKLLSNAPDPFDFVRYLLAGSFIINFLSLLFFYFAQTRYLVDAISQITLLAILGYWVIISKKQRSPSIWLKIFVALANILLAFTILAGFLLAVTGETGRLETLNPLLFEKIIRFFTI